jgi:hypothetical protein
MIDFMELLLLGDVAAERAGAKGDIILVTHAALDAQAVAVEPRN